MRKSHKILLSVFGLIIIIIVVNLFGPDYDKIKKHAFESVKYDVYYGWVLEKYYDKHNHDFPTIKIQNEHGEQLIQLQLDQSKLFNFVKKGDSIVKNYGSYEIKIVRDNVEYNFTFDYGIE